MALNPALVNMLRIELTRVAKNVGVLSIALPVIVFWPQLLRLGQVLGGRTPFRHSTLMQLQNEPADA